MDIVGLYDSLMTASYAGIPFYVIDTSQDVGRRVQRFLFPGVDDPVFQDLGSDDGIIKVRGILVGDDFVQQGLALKAAFRQPGPATLIDPFNGSLKVVMAQPASVNFNTRELRICHFELSLYRYTPPPALSPDTLSALMLRAESTIADAQNWIAAQLAPAVLPLVAFGYAQNWISRIQTFWSATVLSGPAGTAPVNAAASASIAALGVPTLAPSAGWAAASAAAIAAVPAAIAGACTPLQPSAVAPGGVTTAAAAADPLATTTLLLKAVPGATLSASDPAPGPGLATALQALILANACVAAASITYDSQQAAIAQAQALYAALDAGINAAALAAATAPATAAPVWRDLMSLKAAVAADMNTLIGRLPAVVMINVPMAIPVWLLAQYVSGDTPGDVFATYNDIVTRNGIRNPALVPPGSIEVLAP
jgi:prophage DNA circulation protein